MKFCYFVTYCYFLFWVKPLQKLKVCSVFWQFDFVFAVWELSWENKKLNILSQNYSFEELMEKLILSNFLVKI